MSGMCAPGDAPLRVHPAATAARVGVVSVSRGEKPRFWLLPSWALKRRYRANVKSCAKNGLSCRAPHTCVCEHGSNLSRAISNA